MPRTTPRARREPRLLLLALTQVLHATFRAADPAPPELIYERPAGGSERPLSEYLRDELIGLTPLLEREQIATPAQLNPDTLVARLDADTNRTGGIVALWPMIGAWSRV